VCYIMKIAKIQRKITKFCLWITWITQDYRREAKGLPG
jgi:hypothetical protein